MGLDQITQIVNSIPWHSVFGSSNVAVEAARGTPVSVQQNGKDIPITTVRQGSNDPAVVKSNVPGEGSFSQIRSRSG